MNFLKEGKTNWKYILIVVILAFFISGGIWLFCQKISPGKLISPFQETWAYQQTLQKAIAERKPEFCDKINKKYIAQNFELSIEQTRERCKYTYAMDVGDIDYCLTLSDEPFTECFLLLGFWNRICRQTPVVAPTKI